MKNGTCWPSFHLPCSRHTTGPSCGSHARRQGHRACRAHLHCAVLLGHSGARSWGSCPRRVRSAEASQRWRPGPHARQRCAGAGNGRGARAVARPHPGCAASRGAPGRKSRWRGSLGPSAEASAAGAAGYRSLRSPGRRAAAQPALPALTPWRLEANFLCRLNVEPQGSSGFLGPGGWVPSAWVWGVPEQ